MDAFRTLTGGSRFDRKRFASDMSSFEAPKASGSTLPTELDFFGSPASGTATAAGGKKEAKKLKKFRRNEEAARSSLSCPISLVSTDELIRATVKEELAEIDYPAILRKHRIKFTGLDCPNPILSITQLFTEGGKLGLDLEVRVVRSNWEKMGLGLPTAVQMAAWGIMLHVRCFIFRHFVR